MMLGLACRFASAQDDATENYRQFLKADWNMQSAVTDASTGALVSKTDFKAEIRRGDGRAINVAKFGSSGYSKEQLDSVLSTIKIE